MFDAVYPGQLSRPVPEVDCRSGIMVADVAEANKAELKKFLMVVNNNCIHQQPGHAPYIYKFIII